MFAHYAKIPSLIEAIKNGHDVHAATAAMIFHIDLNELLHNIHEHEVISNKRKELVDNRNKFAKEDQRFYNAEIEKTDALIDSLQKFVDMRSKGKTINFALTLSAQIKLIELLESPRGQSAAKPSLMEGSETMKAA